MKYFDVKPKSQNGLEDWLRWQNWITARLVSNSVNRKKINVVIDNDEDWAFVLIDRDHKTKGLSVF